MVEMVVMPFFYTAGQWLYDPAKKCRDLASIALLNLNTGVGRQTVSLNSNNSSAQGSCADF